MIIGGKVWNPGRMRTKVSWQTRTVTTGAGGFGVPGWTTVYTEKVEWINAHGPEVWTAEAAGANAPATVTGRYHSDIDESWAVLKGTERFEIVSLDNIQERNELLEIKVKLLRES